MGWAGSVVCTCWKLHHLAPRTLAHNYINLSSDSSGGTANGACMRACMQQIGAGSEQMFVFFPSVGIRPAPAVDVGWRQQRSSCFSGASLCNEATADGSILRCIKLMEGKKIIKPQQLKH